MASIGFEFHNSEASLPDDFGWSPKYVGGNILCVYTLYVQVFRFLIS
jgi:hypothetical protein